jgi:hypothetical protein
VLLLFRIIPLDGLVLVGGCLRGGISPVALGNVELHGLSSEAACLSRMQEVKSWEYHRSVEKRGNPL